MAHFWLRHRLFVIGIVVVAAATATMLFFARDARFQVGDVAVNPRAPIDPERPYELVLWEEAIVIPWAAKNQSETITDGIRSFQGLYPNVAVSYAIMPVEEAREKLAEAFEQGTPPDIYATARGAVWHPRYSVPASPYLQAMVQDRERDPAGDDPRLLPAAAAMVTRGDVLWGWPRGLWWETWLALADRPSRSDSFAPNVSDILFLEQWMATAGVATYTDEAGALLWTEQRVLEEARKMQAAREAGLLPAPRDADRVARSRVEALVTGAAAGIGPVGPHLAQSVFRITPDRFVLTGMPPALRVTELPAEPSVLLDVSAYFVFRHHPYAGDAHTRLASELAAHLARHGELRLAESLALIPVTAAGWAFWREEAPLDDGSKQLLHAAAAAEGPRPTLDETLSKDDFRQAILPHWLDFLSGAGTPEQFAARTVAALGALVTPESPTK